MRLISASVVAVQRVRTFLGENAFLERHRKSSVAFTRQRHLIFPVVMLLVLQKTVKSIQLHLNEFFDKLSDGLSQRTVTASAWTQARSKLSYTAFIELNQFAVLDV